MSDIQFKGTTVEAKSIGTQLAIAKGHLKDALYKIMRLESKIEKLEKSVETKRQKCVERKLRIKELEKQLKGGD